MTTLRLDPARFHHLADEYRGLAKSYRTQKQKAELLDLAARLTAVAELDVWKVRQGRPAWRSAHAGACSNSFLIPARRHGTGKIVSRHGLAGSSG